jgi:hypothetical protein
MKPFDDRFADRVREVFGAYEEPVDEAALARMRAALGHAPSGAPGRRRDREPEAGTTVRRVPRYGAFALVALALVASVWMWAGRSGHPSAPETARPPVAETPAFTPNAEPLVGEQGGDTLDRSGVLGQSALAIPTPLQSGSRRRRTALEGNADALAAVSDVRSRPSALTSLDPAPPDTTDQTSRAAPAFARVDIPAPVPALIPQDRRTDGANGPPLLRGAGALEGVRLVAATGAVIARGQIAEGAGVAAGVVHDWDVSRGVRISGGAVVAYNHLAIGAGGDAMAPAPGGLEPEETVEVTTLTTLTTLALEIPLDVVFDLAATPRGRLSAAVGLTSALYLTQAFEDEGVAYVYTGEGGGVPVLTSQPYATREAVGLLGRIDLGRQLNLSLGYTLHGGTLPVGVEGYVRLPLGGLTSRDLPLTMAGIRLQVALP